EITAARCLPAFVAGVNADMPGVGLANEIDLTANLIQKLLTGRTDPALRPGPPAPPAVKTRPTYHVEPLVLATPTLRAPVARGKAALPVWSVASHSPSHGRMRDAIAASRIAQKSWNLCNNARMMIDIARVGGGIGIFPEPMVRGEIASGALVELDGMPALVPVEFHVAKRVSDTEPVLDRIY